MNMKLVLSTLLGLAVWSLSSVAAASWNSGACPQPHTGPAPCIETEVNGNTYHFNGDGDHAGEWHGLPAAEGGGAFDFSGTNLEFACGSASWLCDLALSGEVKKCQDSSGAWRVGVRVTDANLSPGGFACNFFTLGGFPWYSKDPTLAAHCPFEDDCDNFLPYYPNASAYTANFGAIDVDSSLGNLADGENMHGVDFNPGVGATFDFTQKTFFDCDEEEGGCSIDGILTLDNATSLDIH